MQRGPAIRRARSGRLARRHRQASKRLAWKVIGRPRGEFSTHCSRVRPTLRWPIPCGSGAFPRRSSLLPSWSNVRATAALRLPRAARSRAALAEKAWYPDLTVGAGPLVQTNNRPPGVAATIGLNIPLPWGREASEQQAATAQVGAAEQHYEAALLDIQGALAEAREKLKAAQRAEALIARKALPEARAAFKSVLSDYSQGRGDLGAALEAEHRVHDLELKLLQIELDEQTALAGIERLIGGEL
jgi:outer membrane protein, heavy metal efflux system